ncbi:MAG: aspartate kinase [Planctomycetes bacterium]|nr:aspartate kinase [Planctomycetota bacterium]MCB9935745.1 aspartate kinase [Planctomycetota bacterium]
MLVMKFGGSSVADENQIHKVLEIARSRAARRPVIVSSAHKGITDALLNAGKAAAKGEPDAGQIVEKQRRVLKGCGCDHDMLDPFFREIEDLLRGISLVREASKRSLDYLAGFGERMSVRVIADYFTRNGVKAEAFDAWDLGFITDENFGGARPLPGYEARMQTEFQRRVGSDVLPVITGFVGKTSGGELTTVGRNGSDFSATCFAAGLGAEECEIWTDTDGVMTADPSLVKDARSIPYMSFAEASELAYYGGRVLHPSTLLPAIKRNIPVRVLNTNRPQHPGTVITEDGGDNPNMVTSIAYKEGQAVITIESTQMLGQPGFLAKVFDVLGREKVDIDMISTSEISVSMTCPGASNLNAAMKALEQFGRVSVVTDKTIVCVVGKNVKKQRGLGAKVFTALRDSEVNVEMISQGANKINLSFLIDDNDVKKAVPALHTALFAG